MKIIATLLIAVALALIAYNLIGSGPRLEQSSLLRQESSAQPQELASKRSLATAPKVSDLSQAREEAPRAETPAPPSTPKRSSVAADTAKAREEPSLEAEADSEEQREEAEAYGENPDAPPVPRAKLIGGADVEWIPPPSPKNLGRNLASPLCSARSAIAMTKRSDTMLPDPSKFRP